MENVVQPPMDLAQLIDFNKKNVKAKRIMSDAIRDHLFPHVIEKKFAYEMWDTTPKFQ